MRQGIRTTMLLLIAGLCLGCSGSKTPVLPDGDSRYAATFQNPWLLWDSWMPFMQYKGVDLSVLVDGDEMQQNIDLPSEFWYEHLQLYYHYTVAATVYNDVSESPYQSLNYAWLDDLPLGSPLYCNPVQTGVLYYPDGAEISAPRVAAIRPYSTLLKAV